MPNLSLDEPVLVPRATQHSCTPSEAGRAVSYDGDSFQGQVGLFSLEGPRENGINAGREGREGALGISCPTGPACHHTACSRWDESSENQSSSAPLLRKAKPIENQVIKSAGGNPDYRRDIPGCLLHPARSTAPDYHQGGPDMACKVITPLLSSHLLSSPHFECIWETALLTANSTMRLLSDSCYSFCLNKRCSFQNE